MNLKARLFSILSIVASLLFQLNVKAQSQIPVLSSEAEISLLTCSPGDEVYSLFGHSAMRVKDPINGFDVVFNYGTFSFNDDFTFNFAMGRLNYQLSIESFEGRYPFVDSYAEEGRGVIEQVLDLDSLQKQTLFNFLNWNAKPENSEYLYDFFYDNCSSRLRDVVSSEANAEIVFPDLTEENHPSFRDMIDRYGVYAPWTEFGIDLGLGLPTDKTLESSEYMFLPDYLMKGFAGAKISGKPLVKETNILAQAQERRIPWSLLNPIPFMWMLFGLVAILSAFGLRKQKLFKAIDVILFFAFGAVGALVFFLWFITDHSPTVNNLNILWAWPIHIIAIPLLFIKKARTLYFKVYGLFLIINLIIFFLPIQGFHPAVLPLILMGLMRCCMNLKHEKSLSLLT